eukprot:CAMPEP_0195506594 /NCGR_PEP_ID=MMETSP0794_2-20130614/173_1 /TAXON_ID=515487 /ORGANISM="Stephanopyxis turris, Strain CCMP 815" /LENGTH=63 /DNA_ID=CAMNT_0040632951 /DNA_START=617 /DNA_END=808 /DNA_ORIENTATION=-
MALYGPGPFIRVGRGPAAGPPLRSLVTVAMQGVGLGLVGAFGWKWTFADPMMRDIDNFYKENP